MGRVRFIYFDVGNVLFKFSDGIEGLAKLTGSTFEQCYSVWREMDDSVCKGITDPQDIWNQVKEKNKVHR